MISGPDLVPVASLGDWSLARAVGTVSFLPDRDHLPGSWFERAAHALRDRTSSDALFSVLDLVGTPVRLVLLSPSLRPLRPEGSSRLDLAIVSPVFFSGGGVDVLQATDASSALISWLLARFCVDAAVLFSRGSLPFSDVDADAFRKRVLSSDPLPSPLVPVDEHPSEFFGDPSPILWSIDRFLEWIG